MQTIDGNWWTGASYGVFRNSGIMARYCMVQSRSREDRGRAEEWEDRDGAGPLREIHVPAALAESSRK